MHPRYTTSKIFPLLTYILKMSTTSFEVLAKLAAAKGHRNPQKGLQLTLSHCENLLLVIKVDLGRKFWMVVPCIWFEIRVNYQLDAIFVYFSSTCFGLIRPSSGAIEFTI